MKVISHSLLCFDQNDRSDSTSSTSLSHFNRGAADLSASVGLLVLSACNTLHSARIPSDHAKIYFESRIT